MLYLQRLLNNKKQRQGKSKVVHSSVPANKGNYYPLPPLPVQA
jgi:hypothetical protein